ncbi:MAG TPA: proton-conducting transporter membrane subunit, partial [Thermodesulfobacteriota bacterium]
MFAMALVGALTALVAATIAFAQNDIKKVLAYSTVSQLGYMFLAVGLGAFGAAIFHVFTHAFFKACLFLGSGSVIHAMDGEQDMRKMGGLKAWLPTTYWTFVVGTIAIAGIPPLAGFFSKDEILFSAFTGGGLGRVLWALGIAAAAMTSFYMFRLVFLTFHGQPRMSEAVRHHLHESPPPMTVPLMALAAGSVVAGFVNVPHALGGHTALGTFLSPVLAAAGEHGEPSVALEFALMGLSVAVAVVGWVVAYRLYLLDPTAAGRLAARFPGLYETLLNKYWVDELYDRVVVRPFVATCTWLWRAVDAGIIDGAVNGVGRVLTGGASVLRLAQSGQAQSYAFYVLLGTVAVLLYVLTQGRA